MPDETYEVFCYLQGTSPWKSEGCSIVPQGSNTGYDQSLPDGSTWHMLCMGCEAMDEAFKQDARVRWV